MPPQQLKPLATFQPPCNARTWLSTPHPHLPLLATACSDKTVRIYSLQNFQQQATISGGHKRSIRSCCWRPNSVGESVLATGSFDASVGVWKRWEENAGAGGEVDFTGRGLAGGGDGEEDEEWRLEVILDGHDSEIKSLQFCPTAPLLATCSRDKSVWIWEELDDGENFETMAVLQDHEGDVKCVGWHPAEQVLASGSYDDCVRLWREDVDDWGCCALLKGHGGTVWWVEFEGVEVAKNLKEGAESEERKGWLEEREKSGPRLITCSDDKTIRVWRRQPKEKKEGGQATGMPSIWKNRDFEEHWFEEAQLPLVHDRPIYAVNWSRKTGRVVSTGSDGKIVVYEEVWRTGDVEMTDDVNGRKNLTEWIVVADVENAHDVFEVNHVVWLERCDKGKRFEGEEVVVSTGDDGEVKVWTLD
ncbi:hypothetical protein PRZ48_012588 [Zasmidium cellare]|uniref:Probable cytosolic iron-sulfur protein assembly protein 1 n=1 Tax=Zasmidium cellare TaxID=395010 RepID=A0ABR0E598_ZASCE|nr:hypothetical protein PRZ48_012588 [Zasmidium cellare]